MSVSSHHRDCAWHVDQYDFECDCGATRPKAGYFDKHARDAVALRYRIAGPAPFTFGSAIWPGLSKTTEEAGEVLRIVGKLQQTGGAAEHFDGTNLHAELHDEFGDLLAGIYFTMRHNEMDVDRINARIALKTGKFERWHAEQGPCAKAEAA